MPSTFRSKKKITSKQQMPVILDWGRTYGKERARCLDPWPSQVDSFAIAKGNMP